MRILPFSFKGFYLQYTTNENTLQQNVAYRQKASLNGSIGRRIERAGDISRKMGTAEKEPLFGYVDAFG
jgi:hypothetical protein